MPLYAIKRNYQTTIPVIATIFKRYAGKKWLTEIYIKNAFLNILINPDHQRYTSFSTEDGHYVLDFLPFGLTGGSMTMQVFRDEALEEVYKMEPVCTWILQYIRWQWTDIWVH